MCFNPLHPSSLAVDFQPCLCFSSYYMCELVKRSQTLVGYFVFAQHHRWVSDAVQKQNQQIKALVKCVNILDGGGML